MQSQMKLADIIYEFSSLLRNISDERETTLQISNQNFAENILSLCWQVILNPLPIMIKSELEETRSPLTLQPLVENYYSWCWPSQNG